MSNAKEIKERMGSIQETKKITNAMYLISSSKMKQAKKKLSDTEPFFYSYMKVKDVEAYYADFFEDFDREQFRKTIERLGLNEEMKASAMSSGMNAKLKAAATLARKADLLLLDEPLNGVDYKAREEIIALILEEADENRTMVISTHLIEEVESFIEDAIFIKDGQLVDVVNVETERMTTGNSLAELYLQKM